MAVLKDQQTKDELLAVMKELSHEFHNAEVARDQIKEIIDAASKTFDISKGLIRKVARFYHSKNIAEYENEAAEVKTLYASLITPNANNTSNS